MVGAGLDRGPGLRARRSHGAKHEKKAWHFPFGILLARDLDLEIICVILKVQQ